MQSDANNPMEKWLKFMARKRQEESPSSWEMPDPMRHTLLREVQKQYSSEPNSGISRFSKMLTDWRRVAWASSFAALFVLIFWLIQPESSMDLAQSSSTSPQKQVMSPTPKKLPTDSERILMEKQDLEMAPTSIATATESDMVQPAVADAAPFSAPPQETALQMVTAPSKVVRSTGPQADKSESPATKQISPQNTIVTQKAKTEGPPVGLTKETLNRYALKASPKPISASLPANEPVNRAESMPFSINSLSNDNIMLFSKVTTVSGPEKLKADPTAKSSSSRQIKSKQDQVASSILNRFSVERSNDQIVITDEDGSKYIGRQWVTATSAPVARSRISEQVAKTPKTYGRDRSPTQMRGASQSAITPEQIEKKTWLFQAIGTNMTTRQSVVLDGSFIEESPGDQNKGTITSSTSPTTTNALSGTQQYWKIKVQAQFGSTNRLNFEAKQIVK